MSAPSRWDATLDWPARQAQVARASAYRPAASTFRCPMRHRPPTLSRASRSLSQGECNRPHRCAHHAAGAAAADTSEPRPGASARLDMLPVLPPIVARACAHGTGAAIRDRSGHLHLRTARPRLSERGIPSSRWSRGPERGSRRLPCHSRVRQRGRAMGNLARRRHRCPAADVAPTGRAGVSGA